MNQILVDLRIDREEWLKLYKGQARIVHAKSRDGRSVQFPANIVSQFLTHSGISGSFVIKFDAEGKCIGVEKIA